MNAPACRWSSTPRSTTAEPIVCTLLHAIATFRGTGTDALVMGDYVLTSEN